MAGEPYAKFIPKLKKIVIDADSLDTTDMGITVEEEGAQ